MKKDGESSAGKSEDPTPLPASALQKKKKKIALKRAKNDFNISKGKIRPKTDFSYLNLSRQKQTLRANNSALAKNLAKTREELRDAHKAIQDLHGRNQDLTTELIRMRRIAGIADDKIEDEVQLRLKEVMSEMKTVCKDLTQSMLLSSQHVNKLYDQCSLYARRSSHSARNSSLGSDSELVAKVNTARRNVFGSVSSDGFAVPRAVDDLGCPPAHSQLVPQSQDMSVIMEQSMMDKDEEEATFVPHTLEPVEENVARSGHAALSKLPQRIPTSTQGERKLDPASESAPGQAQTSKSAPKPSTRPGNLPDNASREKVSRSKTKHAKHKDTVEKAGIAKDKTKIVGDLKRVDAMQSKSASGEGKNKSSIENTKNMSMSVPEPFINDDTAEISAFGFGGNFAGDLVSGSPICAGKPNNEKHAQTSIDDKAAKHAAVTEAGSEESKKIRRDTFVLPKTVPSSNVQTKKSSSSEKQHKDSGSSTNISKQSQSKSKRTCETVVTKKTAGQKGGPINTSSVSQSGSPAGIVNEDLQNTEAISSPYDAIKDPFKPTNVLLRSPPYRKSARGKEDSSSEKPTQAIGQKIALPSFIAELKNSKTLVSKSPTFSPGRSPMFLDEPTTYIPADMELTSVIDTNMLLSNSSVPVITVEDVDESVPKTAKPASIPDPPPQSNLSQSPNSKKTNKKTNDSSKSKSARSKPSTKVADARVDDDVDGAIVEVRNQKPGVFTFNVSRKEADGSRKPMQEMKSKARSKKKRAVTPEKQEERKTGEDRDAFNFGDRTPTMPLDKLEKLNKPAGKSVYDLSMNESVHVQLGGLKGMRNDQEQSKQDKNKTVLETRPDEYIYYEPLKDCSPDEKPKATKRSRSKSGTRSKSRTRMDSEDEEWVPGEASRSKPRALSRGRSVSRKSDRNTQESSRSPEQETTSRQSCSRSRARKVDSNHLEDEDDSLEKPAVSQSRDEPTSDEFKGRCSRSRSKARQMKDVHEEGSPETADHVSARNAQSRSKVRNNAKDDKSGDCRPTESEKERKLPNARSKSRTRSEKINNDDDEINSNDEKLKFTRSKSRTRKSVKNAENRDSDDETDNREASKRNTVDTNDEESFGESLAIRRKSRARSMRRHTDVVDKVYNEDSSDSSQQHTDNDLHRKSLHITSRRKTQSKSPSTLNREEDNVNEHIQESNESHSTDKKVEASGESDIKTGANRSRRKSRRNVANSTCDDVQASAGEGGDDNVEGTEDDNKVAPGKPLESASKHKITSNDDQELDVFTVSPKKAKSTKKTSTKQKSDSTRAKSAKKSRSKLALERESSQEKLAMETPAISGGEGTKKGGKSSKTGGKSVKRKGAKIDQLEDGTPCVKKEKPGSRQETQVKEDRLAALKRKLALLKTTSASSEQEQPGASLPADGGLEDGPRRSVHESNDARDRLSRDSHSTSPTAQDDSSGRSKRNRNPVSYVPLNLNVKLRQGDKLFVDPAKAKAEQNRLWIAQKTSVPKISRDDKENLLPDAIE